MRRPSGAAALPTLKTKKTTTKRPAPSPVKALPRGQEAPSPNGQRMDFFLFKERLRPFFM
jgi:hypothetical protein